MLTHRSRSRIASAVVLAFALGTAGDTVRRLADQASTLPAEVAGEHVEAAYRRLPLAFEANEGQTAPEVKFLARGTGFNLFLTSTEAVLTLRRPAEAAPPDAVLRVTLRGADGASRAEGLERLPGTSHYLTGNDPAKWRRNVPRYARVAYRNVYPGIDLVYYGTAARRLEHDFIVAPGADPSAIALAFEGARDLEVDAHGNLAVHLQDGEVTFHKPDVYQESNGGRTSVGGGYRLTGANEAAFEVAAYDTDRPLVIDPVLSYSTYLGGEGWDNPNDIAIGRDGSVYVAGMLFSAAFPTTPGAYDTQCGTAFNCNHDGTRNFSDAFVTKLSPDGSTLEYSTYFGGSDQEFANDIAVDAAGNAYVTGQTGSASDFPLKDAFQPVHGGGSCTLVDGYGPVTSPCDVFVAMLNPSGSDLVFSSYLGGSGAEYGSSIAVDASGSAYVTGRTTSPDFPLHNALQGAPGGGTCGTTPETSVCSDAFVTKIDSSWSVVYSTYLGGSQNENGNTIAIDPAGNAYVGGATWSADFPTTPDAFRTSCVLDGSGNCGQNAFVTKLDAAGSSLVYSTFLGGSGREGVLGIAADVNGNAYVAGWTNSTDFPTTAGALDTTCGEDALCDGPYYDAFVTKLNAAGSGLVYSTYLGGSRRDAVEDIAVDALGIAYLAGHTDSMDFHRRQPVDDDFCGSSEAFVSKLSANGAGLIFSTFLGGCEAEHAYGIAIDAARDVYVTGVTVSSNFPTTTGAYDTACGADGTCDDWRQDGFVVKLSGLALPVIVGIFDSFDFGEQPVGTTSAPRTVAVSNIGDAPEPVPPVAVTGDFSVSHTCGTAIVAVGGCVIDFRFSPTGVGTRTGEFRAYSIDEERWETVLVLSGVGTAPSLSIYPGALSFPPQPVGTSSPYQTITVRNAGASPLAVTGAATTRPFSQTNNCGATLAVGSACVIAVRFAPTTAGTFYGSLTIASNAPGSPHVVPLSGAGYRPSPPIASVSPPMLNFGDVPRVHQGTPTLRVSIQNLGGSSLTLVRATAGGPFITPDLVRFCGPALAPGDRCLLPVAFVARSPGTYRSDLSIYTNAAGSPHRVNLVARVR
jgi:uncharacterized membrane protein